MKFTQAFNLLALAIAAKSAVIPTLDISEIENRKCQDSFELMEKCILLDEKNLGVSICEIFNSSACQKLYENIDKELELCQNSEVNFSSEYVKDFIKKYTNVCVKDEDGEYCPLASIVTAENFDGFVLDSNKSETEILADVYSLNCASEKCRLATINFIQENREALKEKNSNLDYNDDELVDSINNLGKLITNLQTVQCRDHKASNNTNENALSVLNADLIKSDNETNDSDSDEENVVVPDEDSTVQAVEETSDDKNTTTSESNEKTSTLTVEETTTVSLEETTTVYDEETTTVYAEETTTVSADETTTVSADEQTVDAEIPTDNDDKESSDEETTTVPLEETTTLYEEETTIVTVPADEQTVDAEIPTYNDDKESSDEETTTVSLEETTTVYEEETTTVSADEQTVDAEIPTDNDDKESSDEEPTYVPAEQTLYSPNVNSTVEIPEVFTNDTVTVPVVPNDEQSASENTTSVEVDVPTQSIDSDSEDEKEPAFLNVNQPIYQPINEQPAEQKIPQPVDLEQIIQPVTNPMAKYVQSKTEKPVSKPKKKCFVRKPKF